MLSVNPILYEINTRCWLRELSDKLGRQITLATVPEEEFAFWKKSGFTHIWLMGVWTTGPRARKQAQQEPNLRKAYDSLLPGWTEDDVAGSPYSISDYTVPKNLGGDAGLKEFRLKLRKLGMKLILDFVPNHLGMDHPWLSERPELFVQSQLQAEGTFEQPTPDGSRWIANGKDPYFPPWSDVAQLDYRNPATRIAMKKLLLSIAARCDGVRCDMAMLLLNEVFARTWAHLPFSGTMPVTEFWAEVIPPAKVASPGFLFLAEVYWGLEAGMQSLGFDYTYDKELYDDLFWRNSIGAQKRLLGLYPGFVSASAHFLENHDEPRIASQLSLPEHRAAALAMLGLPGMRFLHEGQLTGARFKVPVQLGQRPSEPIQVNVHQMYETLLATLPKTAVGSGEGKISRPTAAWPGNPTGQNFIIVQWQAQPPEFDLVVVNLAAHQSQCYAPLTVAGLGKHNWLMENLLGTERFVRYGADLASQGVYLDLPAHAAQLFHFKPVR